MLSRTLKARGKVGVLTPLDQHVYQYYQSHYLLRNKPFGTISSVPRRNSPVVLCILDGWGWRESKENNAVILGKTPNFDEVYGHSRQLGRTAFLHASEKHVGLPDGQIGNSEVGHMNIGAGRVVYQDICRIDNAIEDGSLSKMNALEEHIAKLKQSGGTCHVMGLVSPGGVHSMQSHVAEIANTVSRSGIPTVIHMFTDGRDVPPTQAVIFNCRF